MDGPPGRAAAPVGHSGGPFADATLETGHCRTPAWTSRVRPRPGGGLDTMRTRRAVVLLGALSALGFGFGCAGTREAGRDISGALPGISQNREGVVVGVEGNAIAVADANQPYGPAAWFSISPDTEVERAGQRMEVSQISEGQPVRVSFEPAIGAEKTFKVEVLTGQKAEEVKQKYEMGKEQQETPPPPEMNP